MQRLFPFKPRPSKEFKRLSLNPLKEITCAEKILTAFPLKSGRLLTCHSDGIYRVWDTRHELRLVFQYQDPYFFPSNLLLLLPESILLKSIVDDVEFYKEGFEDLIRCHDPDLSLDANFSVFAQLSMKELIWCHSPIDPDSKSVFDENRIIYHAIRQSDHTFKITSRSFPGTCEATGCMALSADSFALGTTKCIEFWFRSAANEFECKFSLPVSSSYQELNFNHFHCRYLEKINETQFISIFATLNRNHLIITTYDYKSMEVIEKLEFSEQLNGDIAQMYFIPAEQIILGVLIDETFAEDFTLLTQAAHIFIFDLQTKKIYQFALNKNEQFISLSGTKLITAVDNKLKISALPHLAAYANEITSIGARVAAHSGIETKCSDLIASFLVTKNPAAFYSTALPIPDEKPSAGELKKLADRKYI